MTVMSVISWVISDAKYIVAGSRTHPVPAFWQLYRERPRLCGVMRPPVDVRAQSEQPTLTTERLTLRPFIADDAFDVERLAGMREIADTTLNIPHPYPHGGAAEWILTHGPAWNEGSNATFAIVDNATDRLAGAISLMIKPEPVSYTHLPLPTIYSV